ncbi:MAG: permease [Sphingomonadales bacterium]|nr:permease [Sphingomonadales bacterium]MDE2169461.1 permease [Sphingomonadales bacterium]
MALCVGAYAYATAFTGKARTPNPWQLHGANFLGAALLVLSLLVDTNWASLVMESIWAAIGLTGLVRAFLARNHA